MIESIRNEILALCEKSLEFTRRVNYCERTNMLCDHVYDGNPADFPTPGECYSGYPNPAGYGTGIEDGSLAGGSMLDACIGLWEKTQSREAADFAEKLCEGLLRCAEAAKDPGYIPRGLSPFDGVSHYPDTSRDQYTLFCYGLHRYVNSGLCSDAHCERIARAARNLAERAERNVTAETGYDLLNENGGATFISQMWEDEHSKKLGNHEIMRLPAFYLFAFEMTGEERFLAHYRSMREYGLAKCLPMGDYWALYTLHQMQSSLRLCLDLDPDEDWRERILAVMNAVADYSDGPMTKRVVSRLKTDKAAYNLYQPHFRSRKMNVHKAYRDSGAIFAYSPTYEDMMDYFTLEDAADLAIVPTLIPGRMPSDEALEVYMRGFKLIDFDSHWRNHPVYFACGGVKLL